MLNIPTGTLLKSARFFYKRLLNLVRYRLSGYVTGAKLSKKHR